MGETVVSILRRLIDAGQGDLPPEAARAVLQLRFAESDHHRMSELAARSNRGALTAAESDEYDAYIAAADLLSLWKSKARVSLKQHTSAA